MDFATDTLLAITLTLAGTLAVLVLWDRFLARKRKQLEDRLKGLRL